MADRLEWEFVATGAETTAAQMDNVGDSLEVLDERSRVAATRFTGVASASSALGTVLSQVNPQIGGMASALGTAGGATSGLVTAIGGVGGLAAGGLIAALSLAVKWFADSQREAERAADEYKRAHNEAKKFFKTMVDIDKYRAGRAIAKAGITTEENIEGQYNAALKREQKLEESLSKAKEDNNKLEESKIVNQLNSLKIHKEKLYNARLEVKNYEAILDAEEELVDDEIKRNEAAKKTAKVKQEELQYEDWSLIRHLEKTKAELDFIDALKIEEDQRRALQEIEQERIDIANFEYELALEQIAEEEKVWLEAQKKREAIEKKGAEAFENAWQGALSTIGSGFTDMAANMIMAQDINAEAILRMVGTQIVKDGIKNTWVGGGLLLNPLTAGNGAALLGFAAAEIAAGAAMGQIAGSGGGGGRGGGGGFQARPTPTPPPRKENQEGKVEIHVHTLNPSVEAGEAIARAVTAFKNKRGRHALSPDLRF